MERTYRLITTLAAMGESVCFECSEYKNLFKNISKEQECQGGKNKSKNKKRSFDSFEGVVLGGLHAGEDVIQKRRHHQEDQELQPERDEAAGARAALLLGRGSEGGPRERRLGLRDVAVGRLGLRDVPLGRLGLRDVALGRLGPVHAGLISTFIFRLPVVSCACIIGPPTIHDRLAPQRDTTMNKSYFLLLLSVVGLIR